MQSLAAAGEPSVEPAEGPGVGAARVRAQRGARQVARPLGQRGDPTAGGAGRDQGAAVTAAVQQAAEHGDHVTRQDLDTLRADVRSEFATVRGEIAQAVATLTWRLAFVQAATIAAVGVLVRLLMPWRGPAVLRCQRGETTTPSVEPRPARGRRRRRSPNMQNDGVCGNLAQALAQSWRAFDRATGLPSRVTRAAPILFFGNLVAYRASPRRVLTVGLNPSLHEFPEGKPFRRFPLIEGDGGREPRRYLAAMSGYFRTYPYRAWFSTFEPLLNGAGASYYAGEASTALHTDICSPIATSPTWSRLNGADHAALEADGGPLWHMLLEALRPQLVVLSVAKVHLKRIEFAPLTEWEAIHAFERTGRRARRWSLAE